MATPWSMVTLMARCSGCSVSAKTVPTRRLRARACAASVCGSNKANSSPPIRNAESEVRKAFCKVLRSGTKDIVAARMAILVVHFLEAMKIQNDDAEWQSITASTIEFFFERFRKETAIVETRQRVGNCVDLEFLEFSVFHENRNANQPGARENVHQRRRAMGR